MNAAINRNLLHNLESTQQKDLFEFISSMKQPKGFSVKQFFWKKILKLFRLNNYLGPNNMRRYQDPKGSHS